MKPSSVVTAARTAAAAGRASYRLAETDRRELADSIVRHPAGQLVKRTRATVALWRLRRALVQAPTVTAAAVGLVVGVLVGAAVVLALVALAARESR